jgi:hypothetical protein
MKVLASPAIFEIQGIKILMYSSKVSHRAPYFKAVKNEKSASISIETGEAFRNQGFSLRELNLLKNFTISNQEILLENWETVTKNLPPRKIPSGVKSSVWDAPPIVAVVLGPDFGLFVQFQGGIWRYLDLSPFILQESGLIQDLKNPTYFRLVELKNGAPTWPNGFDLDPLDFWEVGLKKAPSKIAAAKK